MSSEMIVQAIELATAAINAGSVLRQYINKREKNREEINQANIVSLAVANAKENTDFSDSSMVDVGWVSEFLDAARFVTDENMQVLWSKVLAHEFENPGVTPRRMHRILNELTFSDMQVFQKIASMRIALVSDYYGTNAPVADEHIMVPFSDTDRDCEKMGIYIEDINELVAIGVIAYSSDGYYITKVTEPHPLIYANGTTFLVLKHKDDEIPIGHILLTKVGECIARAIKDCAIQDNYADLVLDYMSYYRVIIVEQTTYEILKHDDHDYSVTRSLRNHRADSGINKHD